MKSKTKLENQLTKKGNKSLVETIILAKKNSSWISVANVLTGPARKKININVGELDSKIEDEEMIVIPGKVLSGGEITKKLKIAALNYSEKAKEKLLKAGCEVLSLDEAIAKNKEAKGVKIIK